MVGDMSNSSQKRSTPSMKPVASPVSVQSATVNTVSARNADVTSSLYAYVLNSLSDMHTDVNELLKFTLIFTVRAMLAWY